MRKSCTFQLCGYYGSLEIVDTDMNHGGGFEYNQLTGRIEIRISKSMKQIRVPPVILHELFEGYMSLSGLRYECTEQNNYRDFFMFNHQEFTQMCNEVHMVFFDIIVKLFPKGVLFAD